MISVGEARALARQDITHWIVGHIASRNSTGGSRAAIVRGEFYQPRLSAAVGGSMFCRFRFQEYRSCSPACSSAKCHRGRCRGKKHPLSMIVNRARRPVGCLILSGFQHDRRKE